MGPSAHPAIGDPKDGERNKPGLARVIEEYGCEQARGDGRARVGEAFGQGESHSPNDGTEKSARYPFDHVVGKRWRSFFESETLKIAQGKEHSRNLAEDKPARPAAPAHPVDNGDEEKADKPDYNGSIDAIVWL